MKRWRKSKLIFAVSNVTFLALIVVYYFGENKLNINLFGAAGIAITYMRNPKGWIITDKIQTDYEILVPAWGQLGNQMFQYASLLAIAKANKRNGRFFNGRLDSVFKLTHTTTSTSVLNELYLILYYLILQPSCISYPECQNRYYDENLHKHLNSFVFENKSHKCVIIEAYLEVWKYFKDIENEIRAQFVFKEVINKQVTSFMQKYRSRNFTLVGVHVRLGDMVGPQGPLYTTRITKYLTKADRFYRKRYKNILYIVCSDDIKRSKRLVPLKNVVYSENHSAEVDMGILASCNHVIRTVGTYGWWAAWLANGTTTYMRTTILGPDYEYPTWIPLEDITVYTGTFIQDKMYTCES